METPVKVPSSTNLSDWLDRILQSNSRKEIFAVLDAFRKLDWSDEESSQMSKLYIRRVSDMPKETDNASTSGAEQDAGANDGPVWYEKM